MRLDWLQLNQRSAYWEHLRTWQSAQFRAEFAMSAFYAGKVEETWTIKLSSEVKKTPPAGTKLLRSLWADGLESKPPKSGRACELPPPPLDQSRREQSWVLANALASVPGL